MKVLLIAPQFDMPTSISAMAVAHLYQWLIQQKIAVDTLYGIGATRGFFESMANKYDLLAYFGHGTEDKLVGQDFTMFYPLLDLINAKVIQAPRVIYTMACLSGIQLGPKMSELNIGYFGHTTYYYAAFDSEDHKFMQDWIEYVTFVPKMLVMGKSTAEAYTEYQKFITDFITEYRNKEYKESEWHIETATKNRDYFRYFGSELRLMNPGKQ